MSDTNIEVVRRGYAAMQCHDVDELLRYCDPEIEFVSLVGEVEGLVYQGHAGVWQFFSDLLGAWDQWVPMPTHYEAVEDRVYVEGTSRLRGQGSGLEMTVAWGQVFRLREGKVLWTRIYSDPAQARAEYGAAQAG